MEEGQMMSSGMFSARMGEMTDQKCAAIVLAVMPALYHISVTACRWNSPNRSPTSVFAEQAVNFGRHLVSLISDAKNRNKLWRALKLCRQGLSGVLPAREFFLRQNDPSTTQ